jgi:hypothetical protein
MVLAEEPRSFPQLLESIEMEQDRLPKTVLRLSEVPAEGGRPQLQALSGYRLAISLKDASQDQEVRRLTPSG